MKGLGYLVSIVSVILLGLVAWPAPGEPQWKAIVTLLGMAASIGGMGLRYLAHRKQQREVEQLERGHRG